MILHYLKIALRNMRKFKLQTIVCLTGLAVGMTCFALGTLWLRYIESFENFVPDAENIYLAVDETDEATGGVEYGSSYSIGATLLKERAEFNEWCSLGTSSPYTVKGKMNDGSNQIDVQWADTSFFRMFGIEPVEGSLAHLNENEVVMTKRMAWRFFGEENAVGKTIEMICNIADRVEDLGISVPHTVVAVIPNPPHNTQFPYEILTPIPERLSSMKSSRSSIFYTFIRKHAAANVDSLTNKRFILNEWREGEDAFSSITVHHTQILPIRSLRTDHPRFANTIQTNYVRWFVMLGLLVIACALCNYLITMVTRIRIREREIALRRVNGASRASILAMFGVETLLLFLLSGAIGWVITWLLIPSFREYSDCKLPLGDIAIEVWLYLLAVTAVGLISTTLTAMFVMRRSRNNILYTRHSHRSSTTLDRSGIIVQLALAMGIIFGATVIMRQIHYISYSGEIGYDVNRALMLHYVPEAVKQRFEQSPLVDEMVMSPIVTFPRQNVEVCGFYADSTLANDTRDISQLATTPGRTTAYQLPIDTALMRFFHYQLIDGRLPMPGNLKTDEMRMEQIARGEVFNEVIIREVCITENVARTLGLKDPVGKKLFGDFGWESYIVVGVLKDLYLTGATNDPDRYILKHSDELDREVVLVGETVHHYYLRPSQGKDQELRDSIKSWRESYEPQHIYLTTYDVDKQFREYMASERLLLNVLWAVALASMFVCVVGAFSLISLSLEERRKEIAIRKVHGATMKNILGLFLRGQVISLVIAAVVAYPIAYIVMRHWLEGYAKQVDISWWLIPTTFLGIAAVVLSTIILNIWRAAKESTVEALNS